MSGPKPKLLLVDDEPGLLLSYQLILERNGYQVDTASASDEARALLSERRYDLLMCDLGLESANAGMSVVEWARRQFPDMPSLLMTGYLDDEVQERADRAGAGAVAKPIQVPKLLELIARIVNSGKLA